MIKIIPSLNGLRALSIIAVLIAHIQYRSFHIQDSAGGQLGVTVFFVISGFLITYLLVNEELRTGTVSLRSFFIRRSIRIFPVFYFLLLVYFILHLLGVWHIGVTSWLSSLTYTKYLFVHDSDWETLHFWSLSVEEHFYLIWPVVFVFFKRFRNLFALLVIVISPLVRLMSDISFTHLFARGDALMWGCLFAMHYRLLVINIKALPKYFLFAPFILLVFCTVSRRLLSFNDVDLKNHILGAFFCSYGIITDVSIALIIVISIEFKHNLYFAFLNSRPMNFLGMLSYSIYLWQQLFFSYNVGSLSRLPFNLVGIFSVSLCSYYLIEKPFLTLKNRMVRKSFSGIKITSEELSAPMLAQ